MMGSVCRRVAAIAIILAAGACAEAKKKMSDGCTKRVGAAEAATLAEVIEGLPDGAVLCLAPGTYPLNAVVKRSLTVRGEGAPAEVVLDGGGRGSVLRVSGARRFVVEKLTITGGAAVLGGGGLDGGADELTAREVIFRGNRADGETPGAAVALTRGRGTLERCRVVDNRGRSAIAVANAELVLKQSLVADNTTQAPAIQVRETGALVLDHATVAGNHADAAIELRGTTVQTPSLEVRDSIVSGPVAVANGPRLAGRATAARSLLDGEQRGVTDGGGNRTGAPEFAGAGAEPYRPKQSSPARGIARAGGGQDLAGAPSGTTAGALQAGE